MHPNTDHEPRSTDTETCLQLAEDRAHDQKQHHPSIGCNGMANNDDYHGLLMYKDRAKDSDRRGMYATRIDPINMDCGRTKLSMAPSKAENCLACC